MTELADDVERFIYRRSSDSAGVRTRYELQVSTPDGRVLFHGDRLEPEKLPVASAGLSPGRTVSSTLVIRSLGRLRLATRLISGAKGPLVIQATSPVYLTEAPRELPSSPPSPGRPPWRVRSAPAIVGAHASRAGRSDGFEAAGDHGDSPGSPARTSPVPATSSTAGPDPQRHDRAAVRVHRTAVHRGRRTRASHAACSQFDRVAEVDGGAGRGPLEQDRRVLDEMVEEVERLGRIVAAALGPAARIKGRSRRMTA